MGDLFFLSWRIEASCRDMAGFSLTPSPDSSSAVRLSSRHCSWRASRVTLFLLGKQWGKLELGELARRSLFVWPPIVARARDGQQGVAWRVAPRVPAVGNTTFRLVTGLHGSST
jgi:hypothetical protein